MFFPPFFLVLYIYIFKCYIYFYEFKLIIGVITVLFFLKLFLQDNIADEYNGMGEKKKY